jgi:hypothetical protein
MSNTKKILYFSFIYLLFLSSNYSYSQLVPDFRVRDDSTNFNSGDGTLGIDKLGNFIIVWSDSRRGNSSNNIYCQRFDSSANRIGNNFMLNTILDTASYPKIAVRKDGSFGVTWIETNSYTFNRTRMKFRLFNKNGIPISSEVIVNDSINDASMHCSIGADTSGKFVIAFNFYMGVGTYRNDIYFQRFDKFGNKIGNNIKVNDDTGLYEQNYPKIAVRQNGSFIITWEDQRPPVPFPSADDIYMQIYDSNGIKIGNNIRVNDEIYLQDGEYSPYINSDTSGAFCIGFTRWNFYPNTSNAILQLYDKNGNRIGNNITVASSLSETSVKALSKRNNGDIVIGFGYDNGYRWRAYFERRDYTGNPIPGIFQVSNQSLNIDNGYADIALYKNNIISLILDDRNGNGDVFCNIRSFIKPDSVITKVSNINHNISNEFILFQNFPNPFNQTTNIKYQIPRQVGSATENKKSITENSYVTLKIYNLLGQEIETLVNAYQKPGMYEVKFNCSTLATGIYFYTLFVDGIRTDTKKLVLLK